MNLQNSQNQPIGSHSIGKSNVLDRPDSVTSLGNLERLSLSSERAISIVRREASISRERNDNFPNGCVSENPYFGTHSIPSITQQAIVGVMLGADFETRPSANRSVQVSHEESG
jgi:hypothetical protein